MPTTSACDANAFRCGWVSSPDGRGTLDIFWSCASALFICLWVMLHLNVPAEEDGQWRIFCRKSRWLLLGLLAPEVLLLSASGQWASAQRSVRDMRALGYKEWTMAHAFYADSGGFVLKARGGFLFPITAKQLHYLVKEGYMRAPNISKKEICDKSKADICAKTIAAFQLGWLVIQCAARAIQHLSVTPLELSTIAIATCTASTYFFWLHKQLDVEVSTSLDLDVNLSDILLRAGESAKDPFRDTPLDFVEPQSHTLSLFRNEWSWLLYFGSVKRKPINYMSNDRNPQYDTFLQRFLLAFIVTTFSTLHFCGWNFEFPTRTEQIVWRTCCAVGEVSLGFHGVHEIQQYFFDPGYRQRPYIQEAKIVWPKSLLFVVPAVLYFIARLGLLVSVSISMRSLPPDAFATVQWTSFVPHF